MSLFKTNKAFTLGEVMIVLTIIGILCAILLPLAFNAMPDTKTIKFQKANMTLNKAISQLINSEKYFTSGDFGKDRVGRVITDSKYFCNSLADILSTKSVNCSDDDLGYNSSALANLNDFTVDELVSGEKIYDYVDCMCAKHTSSGEEIVLQDGTIIYTVNPNWHFGSLIQGETKRLFNLCSKQQRYKYICIDIDNLNEGEAPFGYGLRADGKLVYGSRAQAWIQRELQKGNTESIPDPTPLSNCSSATLNIVAEKDVCNTKEPQEEPFECSGENFMQIGSLCVTRKNMGDSGELSIPYQSDVTVVLAGLTCGSASNYTAKCCWNGETSGSSCDSVNGDYSGCNRTVCTWAAASAICANFTAGNKVWRLPTKSELSSWGTNSYSVGKGNDGLMFCDIHSGFSSSWCYNGDCPNSAVNICYPSYIWTGTIGDGTSSYDCILQDGTWNCANHLKSNAFSVRCVTDL